MSRKTDDKIIVVGGANIDILAHQHDGLSGLADSHPGEIILSAGGVGRNIAENLARLGQPVCFITCFGDDSFAGQLKQSLALPHSDLSYAHSLAGHGSDSYLCVHDKNGEMITAVNHMPLIDRITTTLLKPHTQKLREARLIVADCNLPADTLFWLASLGVPIAVDAVSSAKADRLAPLIGRIDILKCTYPEATRITGRTDSPAELAGALCIENTRIVLMSMGAEPLILATPSEVMSFTPPPARIISVTGAGDALFASFIHQYISGSQITICAEAGLRAAAITMGCRQAVHPEIASLC